MPTIREILTTPLFHSTPWLTLRFLLFIVLLAFIAAFGWSTGPWA